MEETVAPQDLEEIFGRDAAPVVPILACVLGRFGEHQYDFMNPNKYQQLLLTDLRAAMRVYWLEILSMAHFASSASLMRSKRWIDGTMTGARNNNFPLFAASLRGLLESTGDSFYSLREVPSQLATFHAVIRKAIIGRQSRMDLAPDLENALIHFTYARRLENKEDSRSLYKAKQAKEYNASLAFGEDKRLEKFYGALCEVTHPAASSVTCYARKRESSSGIVYSLVSAPDTGLIRQMCQSYKDVMPRIVSLGVLAPLFTLMLLNEFDVRSLHTEAVKNIGLERLPAWELITARLCDPTPPVMDPVE